MCYVYRQPCVSSLFIVPCFIVLSNKLWHNWAWHDTAVLYVLSFVFFSRVNSKQKRSKMIIQSFVFSRLLAFIAIGWTNVLCAIEFFYTNLNLYINIRSKINSLIGEMFLFLGVILATIILYLFRFHYEFVYAFYLSLKMSGPPALPIIGNGLLFINNSSAGTNRRQQKLNNDKLLFHRI